MKHNLVLSSSLVSLSLFASAGVASADPWSLMVAPPPSTSTPPPYSDWVELRVYNTLDDCLASRMSLHYEYWPTDKDLSTRALRGICRDQATGQLAGLPGDDDE